MAESKLVFAKAVPERYHAGLGPVLFVPYAIDIAARVATLQPAPAHVLELACGTGIVTKQLAEALPHAAITASDLSEGMLAQARLSSAAPNVTYEAADMQALPYGDAAFDAVVCQFGLMFPPDKPRALREARRVLKPGGALIFNVWDRIENVGLPCCARDTFAQSFEGAGAVFEHPFALHDPVAMQRLVLDAGFSLEHTECVAHTSSAPSGDAAAAAFCSFLDSSPLTAPAVTANPALREQVLARMIDLIHERYGRPVSAPLHAWVYVVRNPSA